MNLLDQTVWIHTQTDISFSNPKQPHTTHSLPSKILMHHAHTHPDHPHALHTHNTPHTLTPHIPIQHTFQAQKLHSTLPKTHHLPHTLSHSHKEVHTPKQSCFPEPNIGTVLLHKTQDTTTNTHHRPHSYIAHRNQPLLNRTTLNHIITKTATTPLVLGQHTPLLHTTPSTGKTSCSLQYHLNQTMLIPQHTHQSITPSKHIDTSQAQNTLCTMNTQTQKTHKHTSSSLGHSPQHTT